MAKKKMTLEEKLEEAIDKNAPYEVPENWVWIKYEYLTKETKLGLVRGSKEQSIDKKYKYLKMNNITKDGELDLNNIINVDASETEVDNYSLQVDDFLFNTRNSRELVGKNAVVKQNFNERILFNNNIMRVRFNVIANPRVISYYLNSPLGNLKLDEIKKVTTNVAAIYAKDLNNIYIPIPPLKEQQRIVDKIESLFKKLDKAKVLIEEAREDFEKRNSAIFEKAFRGKLTKRWRIKNNIVRNEEKSKLGDIVKINPKRDKLTGIDDSKECTFIPMPSVSEITGKVENPLIEKYSKVKKGYTYFKDNDVIFAKITPCMENGKSAIVTDLIDGFGFGSTEFHVIRCNENVLNRFIYHLVRAKFFRDIASQHMTGAVGQRRVSKNFLEEYKIVLPTLQEQEEIVRILDKLLEEEYKIEELTKLEDQIELIKKSILAKAFRAQLGTNCEEEESVLELLKEILNTY